MSLSPKTILLGVVVLVIAAALMGNRSARRGVGGTEKIGEHILVAEITLGIMLVGLYWMLHLIAARGPAPIAGAASTFGKAASW